jgi:peptidoglycan/xylan/chitin deacetylase (PgdA/CDA1 family)
MTFALIYHDVAPAETREETGFRGPAAARYKLDVEAFDAHLNAIETTGVSVGPVSSGAGAALTFDDGGASALLAAEMLERRGWRGAFFVTTGRIGTPGFLNADGVRELVARGHEVGSHSHTHPTYMGTLTREELAGEWVASREILAELLGGPPHSAAVPGGFLSPTVLEEAARAGYRLLMTSEPSARPSRREGMLVHGRYTIWAATPPTRAAAYACGTRTARLALWLAWQAKTGPKRVSPRSYEAVRQRWARVRAAR